MSARVAAAVVLAVLTFFTETHCKTKFGWQINTPTHIIRVGFIDDITIGLVCMACGLVAATQNSSITTSSNS